LLAEFIGTFALIFVGVGASKTVGHDALAVALAHGLTIAAFVSATLHISGGQFNPAVTFGLVCGGHMRPAEAIRYWIAQLLGAIAAAFICLSLFNRDVIVNGTPQLNGNPELGIMLTPAQGILIEAILTFFLVFVVHGTAVDERGRRVAGLAIGATITLDILFGGPLTGAAMNPARVFGPAVAANF
jgi:MIP family channel proteins